MERSSFLIVSKTILTDKRIPATARLLLAQLWDHRNKRTGQCNPKQATLARELGLSMATIERAIATLKRVGLITIKRAQTCCFYELQIPQSEGSDPSNRGVQIPQSEGSAPAYPLYEPYLKEPSVRAAARTRFPSKNKPYKTAPPPARKSAQSETLEAYYRELRRKEGR
jgi:DNA-binding transcriptional MocR family regulator